MSCENSGIAEWPVDGLEHLGHCPVCGAAERNILHSHLSDRIFFCAPGSWTLHSCLSCRAAYLDPRPSPASIGLAYEAYFTHSDVPGYEALGAFAKIRRRLANGYRNHRYGTRDYPSSAVGALIMPMLPRARAIVDAGMRHLPRRSGSGRLLDLGCGNGSFLLRARSAGWQGLGIDFDPQAIEAARNLDLDVRLGGVEILDASVEQFDVITMSHVIEHVHNPVEVLTSCFELLNPGGVLWLETPNIESVGHERFGADWRGLEPPRHLVLFGPASMRHALGMAGFSDVRDLPYRPLCRETFRASMAIAERMDPYSAPGPRVPSKLLRDAERVAARNTGRREFLTLQARK